MALDYQSLLFQGNGETVTSVIRNRVCLMKIKTNEKNQGCWMISLRVIEPVLSRYMPSGKMEVSNRSCPFHV